MKTVSVKSSFVAFLLAAVSAGAQQPAAAFVASPPATNRPGPKIHFASIVHDFGKITGGEVVKAEFTFTNAGDKLLEVTDVHPSCGCTTAGEWSHQVEPGNTGAIRLEFNSGNFTGPVIKTANVTCNDPEQTSITLQLKATVWRPIEVTPQFAVLQLTTEAPSNATTVRIVNNVDYSPLTLSDVESKSPAFGAELQTIKEGQEYQLIVYTVPPYPTNNVQGQITVKSSSTNMPVINVTAYASVQPSVVTMPNQLTLPPGPLTNKITQTVWIRNNSTNAITVSEPAINVKGVDVQLSAFQQGRYFSLTVNFPPGLAIDAAEHPELSVKTSHPSYPVLKVPVIQPQPALVVPPYGPPAPGAKAQAPSASVASH